MLLSCVKKGALVALFLSLFLSCTKPCQQWEFEKINACFPCGEIGRIYYLESDSFCLLEPELVADRCGQRLYLNVYTLEFPFEEDDPGKAEIVMTIDDQSYRFMTDRFSGGQRLLIPPDATELMIQSLLACQNVRIEIGRYSANLTSNNFYPSFTKLQNL